jgi:hypothetical protein
VRLSRILGSAVVLGVATVFALYLLLHVLRPDYNPLRRFLSEYAVGRFGVLMTAAFLLQALISLALVIGLFRDVRHSGSLLAGCAFLTIAALTLTVAAVFPTDLIDPAGDQPRLITRAGVVHQSAGAISFLARIVAFLSLSCAYRSDNRWQALAPTAYRVALAFLALFFTFVVMVPWDLGGLAQRGAVAGSLLWMFLSGLHLRRGQEVDGCRCRDRSGLVPTSSPSSAPVPVRRTTS